jgi:hypothetical protein
MAIDTPSDLVDTLVAEYSPAVLPSPGGDRTRGQVLAKTIKEVVAQVVGEELGLSSAAGSGRLIDRLHGKLWQRLIQPHFRYTEYVSSRRFQAFLVQIQQELARTLATVDFDEIDSAVFDILRDSLRPPGKNRTAHPFQDFSRYETESQWRRYFSTSAKRRYIRNALARARPRVMGSGVVEVVENPDIELIALERLLALDEVGNLPDTFTESQKDILRHVLQGQPLDQIPHFSEGYIRKVLRKAIAYFQKRG